MYCKLEYNADAGNNNEQVLEDIKDLLLGENNLNNLNGNIDVASSTFDESYEAVAWTLYDSIATNQHIFEMDVHDGGDTGTQKFYYELLTWGSYEIQQKMWTFWDAGLNIGSEGVYYSDPSSNVVNNLTFATKPFTIFISATARHLIIRSVYNGGTIQYFRGFMQYDRGEAWDTPAAGKIPALVTFNDTFTTGTLYAMPHKRSDAAIYTLTSAGLNMAVRYANSQLDNFNLTIGGSSSAARGLNASGDPVHNMYEFGFSFVSSGERFMTGKVSDMYLATYQNGGFGDIVDIGGNNYRIWETDLNYRIAIRDG
jgi:hypothetical protein